MILKAKNTKQQQQEPGIFLATVVDIFAKRNSKKEYVTNVLGEIIIVVVFTLSNKERFIEEFFFGNVNEHKFLDFCNKINANPNGQKDVSEVIGKRLWINISENEFGTYSITKMWKLVTNKKPEIELHKTKSESKEWSTDSKQQSIQENASGHGGQGLLFDFTRE